MFGSQGFIIDALCGSIVLGAEKFAAKQPNENTTMRAYIWLDWNEFYKDGNCLNIDTGSREPIVLVIGQDKVLSHKAMGFGDRLEEISKLFPFALYDEVAWAEVDDEANKYMAQDMINQIHQKFVISNSAKIALCYILNGQLELLVSFVY